MFAHTRHSCSPDSSMPHANALHINIDASWDAALKEEIEKPYFQHLMQFVKRSYQTTIVYPPAVRDTPRFNTTPINKVREVIMEQDPYHDAHEANGLCFLGKQRHASAAFFPKYYQGIPPYVGISVLDKQNLQH